MSIGSLSSLWQQVQQQNAASQASGSSSTQSAQDWLNSLLSATGATPTNDTTLSTATLSDQMQAMLVQLQGGNTTAPDSSGTATPGSTPTSTTEAASGHQHHHHHHAGAGGTDGVDQSTDDLAIDAAGNLTGSDASGLDNGSGGFMQSVTNMLATVGSAAAKGAAAGAVMAAL